MKDLNFNKIITNEEFATISEIDRERLLSMASIEATKYRDKNIYATLNGGKTKAREIINNGMFKDFSDIEKEIMITSIAYDDQQIINLLIKSNIQFIHLEGLCNNITSMKKAYLKNPDGKLLENKHVQSILSVLDKICFIINFSTGTHEEYIIINKLMYIATFKKELYLKLQQDKIIKPQ